MIGEIGTFTRDGEQVGGFKDWELTLKMTSINQAAGRKYSKIQTTATCKSFWLLKDPGEITANYFQLVGDTLALVSQSNVTIDFGKYELEKMINRPLEMIWMNS
jgi:hypothetical protein